jgi:alkylated DNA repair protein alkB family protein 6
MDPATSGAASTVSPPKFLEQSRITSLPSSAYYIPNFISEEEEAHILGKV